MFIRRASIWKGFIISIILLLHIAIAQYASRRHQSGVIEVIHYLQARHESRMHGANTTVAFLMPCHSTPWRSHFIYPEIDAWALTCEPPVNMLPDRRATYVDEADVFYGNVYEWLGSNMESLKLLEGSSIPRQSKKIAEHSERTVNGQVTGRSRPWPQYTIFFEQLEPQMKEWFSMSPYKECARMFNTHWHDDWRRKGDVVVYCLEALEDGTIPDTKR
jgi:phosphatidylinositol glycan class B